MQQQKTMAMYVLYYYYYTVHAGTVLLGNIHVRVQVLRKSLCISSSNSSHVLTYFIYTQYFIYNIYVF